MSLGPPAYHFWLLSHSSCSYSLFVVLIPAGATAGLAFQGTIDCSCPNLRLQSQAPCHSRGEGLATMLLLVLREHISFCVEVVAFARLLTKYRRGFICLDFNRLRPLLEGTLCNIMMQLLMHLRWRNKKASLVSCLLERSEKFIAFHTDCNPIFESKTHSPAIPQYTDLLPVTDDHSQPHDLTCC